MTDVMLSSTDSLIKCIHIVVVEIRCNYQLGRVWIEAHLLLDSFLEIGKLILKMM